MFGSRWKFRLSFLCKVELKASYGLSTFGGQGACGEVGVVRLVGGGSGVRAAFHVRLRNGHLQQFGGEAPAPEGVACRTASFVHISSCARPGHAADTERVLFPTDVVATA